MGKIKCKNLLGVATNLNIGNYDEVGIVPGMNMIDEEIAKKFPHVFKIVVVDEETKESKHNDKVAKELLEKLQAEETELQKKLALKEEAEAIEAQKLAEEQKEETVDVTDDTFEAELKEEQKVDVVTNPVVEKEEIKEEVKATPNKTTKKSPKKKATKKKK